MLVLKISATTSTNSYVKSLLKENRDHQELVVIADAQTQGRGQMGTSWKSQRGKSLTFSVYKRFSDFDVSRQFYLSMAVSLAIKEVLEQFEIPDIKIKWPNDILSANKKICGILIENTLQTNKIKGSIIGIGLNVNENELDGLPNATSMKIGTHRSFDLKVVFEKLTEVLFQKFTLLQQKSFADIEEAYFESLYRIHQVSVFESPDKKAFNGIIQGVSREGKLQIKTEDEGVVSFDFKEIKLISGLQ